MGKELTERQREVLGKIADGIDRNGFAPSLTEIAGQMGIRSVATVHHHVEALKRKGVLARDGRRARALVVTPIERDAGGPNHGSSHGTETVLVPVIGEIAAGEPIHAYEDYQESVLLARQMIGAGEAFILRVRGKSMIEDLIDDGDMVVARKQSTAQNGDIVVALLENNEATLKRFYREPDRIRLQPANASMSPIYVRDLKIQGRVIAVIRVTDKTARKF